MTDDERAAWMTPPPDLVRGCDTPEGVRVLADWLDEHGGDGAAFREQMRDTGELPEDGGGRGYGFGNGDGFCHHDGDGDGDGSGEGDRNHDGDGVGRGTSHGLPSGNGVGDGWAWFGRARGDGGPDAPS